MNDPLFNDAFRKIHVGDWEDGIGLLRQLTDSYPDSEDLKYLVSEMQLRARMDQDEAEERQQLKRERLKKWSIRLAILVVVFGLIFLGLRIYSGWIQTRWDSANQLLEEEVQQVELNIKFRQAQNLLLTDKNEEAAALFQEIASKDPGYPGINQAIQQSGALTALEKKYNQALELVSANNYLSALTLFREIEAENSYFKDVSVQIPDLERLIFLSDTLDKAEQAFETKDWEAAISAYEMMRITDPDYKSDLVENRLYESYLNTGIDILNASKGNFEDLENAESYFQKALSLRPQDSGLQTERDEARDQYRRRLSGSYINAAQVIIRDQAGSIAALQTAKKYLERALEIHPNDMATRSQIEQVQSLVQAQQDLAAGLWDRTIAELEPVYVLEPDFANGIARQTLYEAYLGRGDSLMGDDKFEDALKDFQRASILAEENADPGLRFSLAQAKVAESQGTLENYDEAVTLFSSILEEAQVNEANLKTSADIASKYKRAKAYAAKGRNELAFEVYREIVPVILVSNVPSFGYVVQSGDYLTSLANQFGTTIQAIALANNLPISDLLRVGDNLVIPGWEPQKID
jgi:tetratricopeptide (TPR) repeat protein